MKKTNKEIKLKIGITIPPGLPVQFLPDDSMRCLVFHESRPEPYKVRITSALKAPSMASLERYSNDGICKSVCGERTEPDGWDSHGSPSWLLALGLI